MSIVEKTVKNSGNNSRRNENHPGILRLSSKGFFVLATLKKRILPFLLLGGLLTVVSSCAKTVATSELATASTGTKAVISIGGSAEAYETLEQVAEGYQAKSGTEFDFFPPSQTSSGIEGVKNGTFDVGAMSRLPKADEKSDKMTYISLSMTPLVMVVHESVQGVTDISADQLKSIYKGEIENWQALGGPDQPIVLFDMAEDESEKQLLRDTYLGADLKVSPSAIAFADDDEMLDTAATTDFSIAAVAMEDELDELPVSVLSIDGVFPSTESIESGDYIMSLPLGIAISKTPTSETEAFIDFVMSDEGQELLLEED